MKKLFIGTTMLAAVIAIGFAVSAYAWQPPTVSAPGGNVDAPLNTGPAMQIKSGALGSLDTGWGIFGLFSKFQHGFFGPGCPLICPASNTAGTDLFTAGIPSGGTPPFAPLFKGVSVLDDGTFRLKGNTAAVPGQVLTAMNTDGDVDWQTPASAFSLPNATTTGTVLTATNTTGGIAWQAIPPGLPAGATGNVLAYGTNGWGAFSSLDVRPTGVTIPDGVQFAYMKGFSQGNIHVGDVLTAVNTSGGVDWKPAAQICPAGEYLVGNTCTPVPTNADLCPNIANTQDAGYVEQHNLMFDNAGNCAQSSAVDSATRLWTLRGDFYPGTTIPHWAKTKNLLNDGSRISLDPTSTLNNPDSSYTFIIKPTAWNSAIGYQGTFRAEGVLQNGPGPSFNVRGDGKVGVIAPGGNLGHLEPTTNSLFEVTGGNALIKSGQLNFDETNKTGAAGRNIINAIVSPDNVTSGEYAGILTNSKGLHLMNLAGTGHTSLIAADGNFHVQSGFNAGTYNSSGTQLTNGLKVRPASQLGAISGGTYDANGNLLSGFGEIGAAGIFAAGAYVNGNLDKGFVVLNPPSFNGTGIAGTKAMPLASDVSALSGSAGTDALYLTANPNAKPQYPDQVDIVTNTGQLHFWSTKPDRNNFTDLRAGEGVFGNAMDQSAMRVLGLLQVAGGFPGTGKVLASVDDQGNAQWGDLRSDVTVTPGTTPSTALDTIVVNRNCNPNSPVNNDGTGACSRNYGDVNGGISGGNAYKEVVAVAFCPSDHPVLTGGGADCENPRTSLPRVKGVIPGGGVEQGDISGPVASNNISQVLSSGTPNGWKVHCGVKYGEADILKPGSGANDGNPSGDAHVYAICAKMSDPVVTVNTYIETKGPKTWHPASQNGAGSPAPNPSAATCAGPTGAYNGYNGHSFQTDQVGYIKQTWRGKIQGTWTLMGGVPGVNQSTPDQSPGDIPEQAIATGNCALWRPIPGNTQGQGYGSGVYNIGSDPQAQWVSKVVDQAIQVDPVNDPFLIQYDVWWTYLKY